MKLEKFVKIANDYRDSHIDEIEMEAAFKKLIEKKKPAKKKEDVKPKKKSKKSG